MSRTLADYLSLQEETNDPEEVDETIQELSGFRKVSLRPQLCLPKCGRAVLTEDDRSYPSSASTRRPSSAILTPALITWRKISVQPSLHSGTRSRMKSKT